MRWPAERNFKGRFDGFSEVMIAASAVGATAMMSLPLALIDQILLDYHIGHVLGLVFVLSVLAVLPLRSRKVLSLVIVAFGLIFILTPFWVIEGYEYFMYGGLGLIFVGTMLWAYSDS